MPKGSLKPSVRVLVLGPMTGRGGLATVARQTTQAALLPNCILSVLDTTRPPGPRSRARAIVAHLGQIVALCGRLRSFRPPLVHLHTCSNWTFWRTTLDILVSRLFGAAVVLHVHGGFFDRFLDELPPCGRAWAAFHLRLCRCIVVLSAHWRQRLLQRIPGLATAVLPNAVDTKRYAASGLRRGNRVLYVGELSEAKGIDDLLRAWARLPDDLRRTVRLRVAGDDPQGRQSHLRVLCCESGVLQSVDWLGPLTHDRLTAEYAEADVFVLPSHGEGMPLSLLEAMAAGLACVVTDVGAVPEIITANRDAFVVCAGNPAALAEAMTGLLRDADMRRSIGSAARKRAADFDIRQFHPRLEAVWQRAISAMDFPFQHATVKNSA